MMKYVFSGFMALVMLVSCGGTSSGQKGTYKLAPDEFEAKYAAAKDAQLIDVCTPGEFSERHIKGAINIDFQRDDFEQAIGYLDKDKPVFIYCFSGGRSGQAYDIMQKLGFKEVYELQGGISNWMKMNKPTEKKNLDPNKGISENDYNSGINAQDKVLVVFSTTWCPPCKKLTPVVDELEKEFVGSVKFMRLDGDEDQAQASRVQVQAYPTLILYHAGKEVWRHTGMIEKELLATQLKS